MLILIKDASGMLKQTDGGYDISVTIKHTQHRFYPESLDIWEQRTSTIGGH